MKDKINQVDMELLGFVLTNESDIYYGKGGIYLKDIGTGFDGICMDCEEFKYYVNFQGPRTFITKLTTGGFTGNIHIVETVFNGWLENFEELKQVLRWIKVI